MLVSLFCCTELWRQLVREKTWPLYYNNIGDKWLLERHMRLYPAPCCAPVQTFSLRLHLQQLVRKHEDMFMWCACEICEGVFACGHYAHMQITKHHAADAFFPPSFSCMCWSVGKRTAMWCCLFVLVVREKAGINGFSLARVKHDRHNEILSWELNE